MHVAMAMIPPLSRSGKTPRVSIARPANRAILAKIKAIVSPPSVQGTVPIASLSRLPRTRSAGSANGPKINAMSSQALVDLPRARAILYAAGIEAIATNCRISHIGMDDSGFADADHNTETAAAVGAPRNVKPPQLQSPFHLEPKRD
jgi:hypothetical protein